ncbi:MAG: RHS repeat-associated core domain-containing protein, partial [Cyclobacteriaceae bacterium]
MIPSRHDFNGTENLSEVSQHINQTFFRLYDKSIGKWLGVDPVDFAQWNPYNFGFNNPAYFTDPHGDCPDNDDGNGGDREDCSREVDEWFVANGKLVIVYVGGGASSYELTENISINDLNELLNEHYVDNKANDELGGFHLNHGNMQAGFGSSDYLTSAQLAISALAQSFHASAYESFKGGGKGKVPFHLKKNVFKSYKSVNNNALRLGKVSSGFAKAGSSIMKVGAPALTGVAVITNGYSIVSDGKLTWGDAFVAVNTGLQIAFPVYGVAYGVVD